jgi:tetratricopeptide (TPR) repeat protein
LNYGLFCLNLGNKVKADSLFEIALRKDADVPKKYLRLAFLLSAEREYDRTEKYIKTYLHFVPDDLHARNLLANTYRDLNRFDEAMAVLEDIARHGAASSFTYRNLGECYSRMRRYREAIAQYEKALALEGSDSWGLSFIYSDIANVYLEQGQCSLAVDATRRAMNAPGDGWKRAPQLARAYFCQGEIDSAIAACNKVKRTFRADTMGETFYVLAMLYNFLGERQKAKKEITEALELAPDDPYNHLLYLLILLAEKRTQDFRRELLKVRASSDIWPGPLFKYVAGEFSEQQVVQYAKEAESFERSSRECEAYYYMAMTVLYDGKRYCKTDADSFATGRRYLERSISTKSFGDWEYDLARYELDKLKPE